MLAQWRFYPRLKKQCEMQVCRPQENVWKPPLPQYAGRCTQWGNSAK